MDLTDLTTFGPSVIAMIGGAAGAGVLEGTKKAGNDFFYGILGYKLDEFSAKKRVLVEYNVQEYKNSMLNEIGKIKSENIQEAKLNILGPALEASKYYIEEEKIRDMFAKLIAASMDSSKNNVTHNSFVEIIKQMSPLDAENLVAISDETDMYSDLICNIFLVNSDGDYNTSKSNLFLGNKNNQNQGDLGISLSNLSRLGLIDITYEISKIPDDVYSIFKESDQYKLLVHILNHQEMHDNFLENSPPNTTVDHVEMEKGIIRITDFGLAFISVCL